MKVISTEQSLTKPPFYAVLMYSLYGHPRYFKFKRKCQQHGPCFQTIFPFFVTLIFSINHDGAEISVIWFIERSAIKLLILCVSREKQIWGSEKLHCQHFIDTAALFYIGFSYLFFDVKKGRQKKRFFWRQDSYDNSLRSFVAALFMRDAFRPYQNWNKLVINQWNHPAQLSSVFAF